MGVTNITIVGGGNIGSAIAKVLGPRSDYAVTILTRRAEQALRLEKSLAVEATHDPGVLASADVIIFAVKPQDMPGAVSGVVNFLRNEALVISIATGISIATLRIMLGGKGHLCRATTTTAAMVARGTSALAGDQLDDRERRLAESIFSLLGSVHYVEESQIDAANVIANSASYLYFLTEVLTHAGVSIGLTMDTSRGLVQSALVGTAAMVEAHPERHAVQLREDIMSRGGVTIAAFRLLETRAVRGDFFDAVEAAHARCVALGIMANDQVTQTRNGREGSG